MQGARTACLSRCAAAGPPRPRPPLAGESRPVALSPRGRSLFPYRRRRRLHERLIRCGPRRCISFWRTDTTSAGATSTSTATAIHTKSGSTRTTRMYRTDRRASPTRIEAGWNRLCVCVCGTREVAGAGGWYPHVAFRCPAYFGLFRPPACSVRELRHAELQVWAVAADTVGWLKP